MTGRRVVGSAAGLWCLSTPCLPDGGVPAFSRSRSATMGYEIQNRLYAKGRDAGFEIRGVSDELLAKYSQRSRQRDQAIREFAERDWRLPSDNEVAELVRESRTDKLIEISIADLRKRQ